MPEEKVMRYEALMVQLELEHAQEARLQIAGDLADRFGAKVIGIAACEHSPAPYYADGAFAQGVIEQDRAELLKQMNEAEARFRAAVTGRAKAIEWRSALAMPTDYVAREARAADLIITGANRDGPFNDPFRRVNPSALVMQVGRPVFFVPQEASWLKLQRVLVAWKDTREARRAVWDALPLLQQAKEVNVVEIIEDETSRDEARARVDDVVAWLGQHNVMAFGMVPDTIAYAANQLETVASETSSDVLVAGAYGHSRLTEWIFGGVTRDLLTRSARCSLLAH